jgi:HK97 family phage major capsid protein
MSNRLKELREKRAKIVTDMRAILEKADTEKRSASAEEQARYDEMFGRTEELRTNIATEERQIELEREMAASADREQRENRDAGGEGGELRGEQRGGRRGGERTPDPAAELRMKGFRSWLRNGAAIGEGAAEFRNLSVGVDTEGGFLVAPEQFVQQLIQAVDDQVFVRSRATVIPVPNASTLGVPTLEADPDDADWTTELQTGSEDGAMKFGKRSLIPHPFAKRIKVSNDLLRKSLLPAEQIVMQRLAYKFGLTEEKGFLTGDGVGKPLGVFTASGDGIPTGRDIATENTATQITFNGLINAKYSVKAQYWPKASWTFHRDAVKQISKIVDGEGQYVWRQSVREGEPDTILGHPMDISEYVPNTFTTGLYVGLFGDWSFYWIADALNMQMQRLAELYAETNQVGFIGRQEVDGMPVLPEAFARIKLA